MRELRVRKRKTREKGTPEQSSLRPGTGPPEATQSSRAPPLSSPRGRGLVPAPPLSRASRRKAARRKPTQGNRDPAYLSAMYSVPVPRPLPFSTASVSGCCCRSPSAEPGGGKLLRKLIAAGSVETRTGRMLKHVGSRGKPRPAPPRKRWQSPRKSNLVRPGI